MHNGFDRKLGGLHFQQIDLRLEIKGRQRALVIFMRRIAVEIAGDQCTQPGQRHLRRGVTCSARRHPSTGAACGLADEALGALDRGCGNAGPYRGPREMRNRSHGLGVDPVVALREDHGGGAVDLQLKAGAAGASHAERLPALGAGQRVMILGDRQEHLVRGSRVIGAAGDGDNAVGFGAVGNHGGVADQRNLGVAMRDGSRAGADVAAVLAFRGRRCKQQLLYRHAPHQVLVILAADAVPDQAGNLGLMHRKDHGAGGAGAAKRVADLGDVGDRCAEAAEGDRNQHAEKLLLARRVESGLGKTRREIHVVRIRRGGSRDCRDPFEKQRAPVHQQTIGVTGGRRLVRPAIRSGVQFGLLDIHARPPLLSACSLRDATMARCSFRFLAGWIEAKGYGFNLNSSLKFTEATLTSMPRVNSLYFETTKIGESTLALIANAAFDVKPRPCYSRFGAMVAGHAVTYDRLISREGRECKASKPMCKTGSRPWWRRCSRKIHCPPSWRPMRSWSMPV